MVATVGPLLVAAASVPMVQVTVLPPPVLALPAPPSGVALRKLDDGGAGMVTVTLVLAVFV